MEFLYCSECGKPMYLGERRTIEPCWNCINAARETERRKQPELQKGREEIARRMEEATERIREEYR